MMTAVSNFSSWYIPVVINCDEARYFHHPAKHRTCEPRMLPLQLLCLTVALLSVSTVLCLTTASSVRVLGFG